MAILKSAGKILKGQGGSDYKVSVEEGLTPGYLAEVVEVESPITMEVTGNKLHFRWDGTSNNTLTLISNMSLANAVTQTNATTATTSPGNKYGMTLSAFDIPNYFNLAQSDVFGIVTTNVVSDVTLFKVVIYKLDFDTNTLNLVAISKDYSEYIHRLHGYMEVQVDSIYRPSMDSYGIYYVGIMTDQPSVMVAAGQDAVLFNNYMPLMGINFHNVNLDTLIQSINLSTGEINGTSEIVSFQESVTRICCIYRHILDEDGEPVLPDPDTPTPPTPEDPTTTYEQDVIGSMYWLQTSCDSIIFTFSSDYGPVVNIKIPDGEDWSNATKTNVLQDYSDGDTFKYKFGDATDTEYTTTITNTNGDVIEITLYREDNQFVEPSKIVVKRV